MSELALHTLGFPELHVDGRPGNLNLRKALALITYLAETHAPVSRETAATLLWPNADSTTSRTRLRRLLHRIDRAVGCPVIDVDRASIRLGSAVDLQLDSQLFEHACDRGDFEKAASIYRADFLDGFLLDSSEFDDWAFFRREALRSRLINALERIVLARSDAGHYSAAAEFSARLAELDPLSEVYARYLIRSLLLAGDRSGAERHYSALERRLCDDLGISPEPETQELMRSLGAATTPQPTRYAYGGGVHLAYQVHGGGGTDILVLPGFVSSVERLWELPACRSFMASVKAMGRLIIFDSRGIGLSDRGLSPSTEGAVEDIDTVLRAVKSQRAILFAASQSAAACIKFAVERPDGVAGLVLVGALARGSRAPDYPFALSADQFDTWRERLVSGWGEPIGIETFAPSLASDAQARAWWAGLLRAALSPGALKTVLGAMRDMDVRALLPHVSVPTLVMHRRDDQAVRVDAGRYIAKNIPNASFVELDGDDHWFFSGPQEPVLDAMKDFIAALNRST
jgi:DNA-binding SARP family transcriptional activator/pimeloyl-ACP methyl ester carboxylesterase